MHINYVEICNNPFMCPSLFLASNASEYMNIVWYTQGHKRNKKEKKKKMKQIEMKQ